MYLSWFVGLHFSFTINITVLLYSWLLALFVLFSLSRDMGYCILAD